MRRTTACLAAGAWMARSTVLPDGNFWLNAGRLAAVRQGRQRLFGLMRLPKLADGKSIDVEQTKKRVDLFMEAGGTYFDTAYVYDDGRSEEAIREALVKRYPRESYTLCTKLCAWLQCHDERSAKQQFYTSLERTQAGYFDCYLLHALQAGNYKKYDQYHIWDFVKEQKEKGLICHFGFSFHADPGLLEQLLNDHPEVDFIQLQINYADWENPDVLFRSMSDSRMGLVGIIPASLLGIASPLCMYGTIPLAASFSRSGMRDEWLASFMMCSILLNPQLIIYSTALGTTALAVRRHL